MKQSFTKSHHFASCVDTFLYCDVDNQIQEMIALPEFAELVACKL